MNEHDFETHLSRLCLPHSPIHADLATPNLKLNFHSQDLLLEEWGGLLLRLEYYSQNLSDFLKVFTSWLAILRASSTDSTAAKLT